MPDRFDTDQSVPDVGEKVIGDVKAEPVVETKEAPVEEFKHPDVKLKLNPDKNLDSPSFISVPNFPEIELSTTAKAVEFYHAELLLSSGQVVAE